MGWAVLMAQKKLLADLPVCPEPNCRRVGRLPGPLGLKGYCTGGLENPHKKRRMETLPFVEERRGPERIGAAA
jgi:hypothetical protein